ncbi:hypothetical protein TTHERM_00670130 (macronuclear) [Tetrahymena thermophila SB210]|uniref:Uncharacterized protein n=1 Tax=Tetrahymena thermophila (strain SB210) TaxID=312017 RepID=I7MJA0_TETTS|nr:hypothetical protein TTHERM_00670130 [Tetrahymena thermophila SB210]EAS06089.2 hypothetical protein TTHERM_00670130 [Tetrahymena thermophila SB210]|eukprot:XP_001026334.2 hypothetical protein TTHERM_00670130 [Tetrahymena thermophila SB210]
MIQISTYYQIYNYEYQGEFEYSKILSQIHKFMLKIQDSQQQQISIEKKQTFDQNEQIINLIYKQQKVKLQIQLDYYNQVLIDIKFLIPSSYDLDQANNTVKYILLFSRALRELDYNQNENKQYILPLLMHVNQIFSVEEEDNSEYDQSIYDKETFYTINQDNDTTYSGFSSDNQDSQNAQPEEDFDYDQIDELLF